MNADLLRFEIPRQNRALSLTPGRIEGTRGGDLV